jgi:hypothetical protein
MEHMRITALPVLDRGFGTMDGLWAPDLMEDPLSLKQIYVKKDPMRYTIAQIVNQVISNLVLGPFST